MCFFFSCIWKPTGKPPKFWGLEPDLPPPPARSRLAAATLRGPKLSGAPRGFGAFEGRGFGGFRLPKWGATFVVGFVGGKSPGVSFSEPSSLVLL